MEIPLGLSSFAQPEAANEFDQRLSWQAELRQWQSHLLSDSPELPYFLVKSLCSGASLQLDCP